MSQQPAPSNPKLGRFALGLLAFVLVIASLAAAKTWLKPAMGDPLFTLLVAVVTITGMGFVNLWLFRYHNGLDEVHKAGAEFAARWSMPAGQAAFVLLLFLPPFRDLMTSLVVQYGGPGPGMVVDRSVVVFAMALGFMGVVMLQAIATMVFSAFWWKSKQ